MIAPKFLTVIFVASILASCAGFIEGKDSSEKAITHFHELYNDGNVEQIWQEATPGFRDSSPRAKYDEFLGAVQRKLGKVVSSTNVTWNVQSFNGETIVSMSQDTTFEQGQGTEAFTFKMDRTNAKLHGYNIQSTDLIIK